MSAELITRLKDVTPEGDIIELVIWRLPESVPPSGHRYKYRLVYVRNGQRLVGFDNERGQGDHCHIGGKEHPYQFSGPDQLIEDFIKEVQRCRNGD
ncbi:hypothetical protein CKO25_10375 [Thiocapsa imhoffii]|uniref:Uncharacterized protein n=1 Tax=Thiocapsa imhoffii TaxID=382777 RepID=A0A9X1B9G6_9GAMM|nr:hypothetical protein [Thiocapsa imhoffii]